MTPPIAKLNDCISISRHVHFDDELAKPPAGRPRMFIEHGLVYPRVAQLKGEADGRVTSFDLHWKLGTLSKAGNTNTIELAEVSVISLLPIYATEPTPMSFTPAEQATPRPCSMPKLPSTPLSNLLLGDSSRVHCNPPLLCSPRFFSDNSSLDGSSTCSSSSVSFSSSDSDA
ncbi:hypothetical protein D9757_004615 [Collybiopsis confluens]|uniref:Uncharacterized protein n=1 Tax=Collybiopsis confluens TaxID=2823264 RepID=A0A8H5MCF2_9AGAR|nr:hypothetical protein D9757_004615 [Collybiopsis confluens]